jgi:hypothetical protein
MQFGGELEVGIGLYLPHPKLDYFRLKRLIKGTVNFNRIQPAGQKFQGMKPRRISLREDHTFPVLVGPAGCSNARGGRHGRISLFAISSLSDNSEQREKMSIGNWNALGRGRKFGYWNTS